jgi:hypothetical protein
MWVRTDVVPAPAEQGEHLALARRQPRQRRVRRPVPGPPCGGPPRPACRGGHAGNQVGRALQAEGGVDQHQVEAKAGDAREGVLGRRAAADHLMDLVAGRQRLQRLVEQRLESASSTRAMTIPSSRASDCQPSGCLLWPIRHACAYYSRRILLYVAGPPIGRPVPAENRAGHPSTSLLLGLVGPPLFVGRSLPSLRTRCPPTLPG